MATYTINLYPSSDIEANHATSVTDSDKYAMINDVTDDSGSSNIYHTLSTNTGTVTSTFGCTANSDDNPPTGKIKIKSVKIETYWTTYGDDNVNSLTATLTPGIAFGDTYTLGEGVTKTSKTESYELTTTTFSNLSVINLIFNSINDLNAKILLKTSGSYSTDSTKNVSAIVRISSSHIVLEYELEPSMSVKVNGNWVSGLIKAKQNGLWKDATSIYKKENGSWTLLK